MEQEIRLKQKPHSFVWGFQNKERIKMSFQHDKGKIKHNALAALVTSNAFLPKKEKTKKGKGSYNRNSKHKSDYSYKRIF